MSQVPSKQANNAIFARFGAKFGVDGNEITKILKSTAFKVEKEIVTDEQMATLLVVAEQFNLNPFLREIYAFPDTHGKGIIPIIPIDGWTRIANEHPAYDGVEFVYSEETTGTKKTPLWIEAVIYRKDRSKPTRVREYLQECQKSSNPWTSHPQRMLRHKAFMQCARVAFSFSGIYDEDEAERIATARVVNPPISMTPAIDIEAMAALPSAEEQFLELLQGMGKTLDANVEEYLRVCQHHFKCDRETTIETILQAPEQFSRAYPGWEKGYLAQRAQPTATQPTQPQQATVPQNAKKGKAKSETVSPSSFVYCPHSNTSVEIEDCDACTMRNGCPEHFDGEVPEE